MIPRLSPNYGWKEMALSLLPCKNKAVEQLEQVMAQKAEHSQGIAFRYGRSGLYYLLKALGAQNKKVIMPSYTCVVVAHSIICSGNIPVFLDNAPGSFQPNPQDYLDAIDDQTIMIIPTHLFGITQDSENLYKKIKENHPHVFVLQDCAHSFFCEDQNANVITKWGDGALFGMNISKLVNTVKGGMLTLKDPILADKVRKIFPKKSRSSFSLVWSRLYVLMTTLAFSPLFFRFTYFLATKSNLLKSQTQYFEENTIELPCDFDQEMSAFEATIGLLSFKKYTTRISHRRRIAQEYIKALAPLQNHIQLPSYEEGYTWSHFPILVPEEKRQMIMEELKKYCELGTIVDYSVSSLSAYQRMNHPPHPQSLAIVPRILNLPLTIQEGIGHFTSSDKIIKQICHTIIRAVSS